MSTENATPLVGVIMGSQSDWETMSHAVAVLEELAVPHEVRIISAHRTPARMATYAAEAAGRGLKVIVAGAGGAAHLPGMVAAQTWLPVLGVPVESKALSGMDSLLSIAQMPGGVPVGTLAIGKAGAKNAGLLAASIVGLSDPDTAERLEAWRNAQTASVAENPGARMSPLPPGSTIGVLGGGQLGRMMALAAARLGYRVHVFTPEADSPTEQVSASATVAAWDDMDALDRFAASVDAISLEFENVPVATVEHLAAQKPVRPGANVLAVAQDRLAEKTTASQLGIPVAPFEAVTSQTDLEDAIERIGAPSVLKTRREGYDGKGQQVLRAIDEAQSAFEKLGRVPAILEGFVDFTAEISVIVARGNDGAVQAYPAVENRHRHHILDLTIAPASVAASAIKQAETAAIALAEQLEVVGLLAVEFFVAADDTVLFNEMAPRPHNSGHWTIEACPTSQFEQQVRATVGLPLGPTGYHHRAVMRNLIGDDADTWLALSQGSGTLHLYGKAEARPGRKMGHVTRLYAPDRPNWPPDDADMP